jgi:predicted nuclease of restriction endonuclease-like (RecB) superfamily
MSNDIVIKEYKQIFQKAKEAVIAAQQRFLQDANRTSIDLYWELGRLLAEAAKRYQWGKGIIAKLSADLAERLGNIKGYSPQNLRFMRQFYYEYVEHPELLNIAREVRWRTNILIMSKVKNRAARKFYLEMAKETLCTKDAMDIQIKSQAYEREQLAGKTHNFKKTLPATLAEKAENILKPSYFLEVTEPFSGSEKVLEKHIETHMIEHIKKTIMMLGKGFSFIGNQYRIEVKDNEYFIDLLFFNRILHSLFAVEIKNKKFRAEYAGKMNLYLGLLDDYVKQPDENPSIGLILCTDKNSVEADYALRDINKPMGIAEITLSKVLPENLADKLPDTKLLENEILQELKQNKGPVA